MNPINHNRPDTFALGLKLIGEALIDSIRGLGRQSVDTYWSKSRSRGAADCCQ